MRRLCVFTGSRAEYGLLTPLLEELQGAANLDSGLIVTGTHLSPEFGHTVDMIEADGFRVDAEVEMLLSSDTAVGAAKSMALAMMGIAEALDRLRPDLLVVLGDRYEVLAAAAAALLATVPVAHIGGGESTVGAVDDSVRHAVTKMSHLHFPATEPFRQRILQLGEDPARVHAVGALGLDNVRLTSLLDRSRLAIELGTPLDPPVFLVTQHPATADPTGTDAAVDALLSALDAFPEANVIFTNANADVAGRGINASIAAYAAARSRARAYPSLGRLRYLSLLCAADVVVGNSSSGLIEAPALGTPTVDIGDRQRGRPRAACVLGAACRAPDIVAAIERALSPPIRERARLVRSPYGDGYAAPRIRRVLATYPLEGLIAKQFIDHARADVKAAERHLEGDSRCDVS
jgi:UDP-hydrolysing UDP-N-acetyl-D-glucosamine 2-epimerase